MPTSGFTGSSSSGGGGGQTKSLTIGIPCPIGHSDKASQEADKAMLSSSFIIEMTPKDSKSAAGINTLNFSNCFGEYAGSIKQNVGYDVPSENGKSIKLAVVTEGAFSESFDNQLGDSFMTNMSSMIGSGATDVRQILGGSTVSGLLKGLGDTGITALGNTMNMSDSDKNKILENVKKQNTVLQSSIDRLSSYMPGQDINSLVVGMLTGNKIDFPKLWKASSMTASYSFTVRLYCPNPDDDKLYMNRIVGPLTSLTALALPRTRDDNTYYWPYYVEIKVPGNLKVLTMLTSIAVAKGGDSRAWNISQKPYIVDVRIAFSHLYNAMLLPIDGKPKKRINGAPYIDTYADAMKSGANYFEKQGKTSFKLSPSGSRGSGGGKGVGDGQE
jgi:hypothetical protein